MTNTPNQATVDIYQNIPQELKERRQWVLWKFVKKQDRKKPTKVPYQINHAKADTMEPDTWATFEEVIQTLQETGIYHGIGYVFSKDDPYTGIDFDNCVREGRDIHERVREDLKQFNSYVERSQSRDGIHAIVRADLPSRTGRKTKKNGYEIEVYNWGRFFVMTGNYIKGLPQSIEPRQNELNDWFAENFPPQGTRTRNEEFHGESPNLTDEQIIEKASNARNGEVFKKFFYGGPESDHSSSDLALCNILAFYTQDFDQIDRIFRQSALMRDKWDERRGQYYYNEKTIHKALLDLTDTYNPNRARNMHQIQSENGEPLLSKYQTISRQETEEDEIEGYFIDIYGRFCYGYTFEKGKDRELVYSKMILSNFTAVPLREIIKDGDLNETDRYFEIEGYDKNGRPYPNAVVKAEDFAGLTWVATEWGLGANIGVGKNVKERLRHGIQSMATGIPMHFIYTHTGWREVITKDGEKKRTFLIGGGDIHKNNIEVELDETLSEYYRFTEKEMDIRAALHWTDKLILQGAPLKVTAPLAGKTFVAPLSEILDKTKIGKPSGTLWLHGRSRSRKSVLAALFGNHYSTKWDWKHFPAGFDDTYYSIEKKLYYAKDVLMVVDDYYPPRTKAEYDRMNTTAQKIIRSMGNLKGKGRLTNTLESRKEFFPRCTMIVTGEQLPNAAESDLRRIFSVPIKHGDANIDILHELAEHKEDLNVVGREYIRWVSSNYKRVEEYIHTITNRIYDTFKNKYGLKDDAINDCTHLFIGIHMLGIFQEEMGFHTRAELKPIEVQIMDELAALALDQFENETAATSPTEMFMIAVEELIQAKVIRLEPHSMQGEPLGGNSDKIAGYFDSDHYYLINNVIYNEVKEFYKRQDIIFPLASKALNKVLAEENKIKTYKDGNTIPLMGKKGRFLALHRN